MDYMSCLHKLKGQPQFVSVTASEEFTKEEALNQMIEQWIPEQYRDLNCLIIDGTETTADTYLPPVKHCHFYPI